jgi:hypothetical protein
VGQGEQVQGCRNDRRRVEQEQLHQGCVLGLFFIIYARIAFSRSLWYCFWPSIADFSMMPAEERTGVKHRNEFVEEGQDPDASAAIEDAQAHADDSSAESDGDEAAASPFRGRCGTASGLR